MLKNSAIIRKKFSLLTICLLTTIIIGTLVASAQTLDVGSGQKYATSGINDQIPINNAIAAAASGDVVYIHTGTYHISAPINANNKNSIIIKGDGTSNTIIQASSYDAFFGSGHLSMIQAGGITNSEIYGFTIKGYPPQVQPETINTVYEDSENGIYLYSSANSNKIHDLKFIILSGDGIYGSDSSNNAIYNCVFDTDCHDCVQCWSISSWHIYNCSMNITSDCGIRFVDSRDSEVSNCTMYSASQHENGGVYFQNTNHNITVDWNVFRDMYDGTYSAIYTTPWYDICDGEAKIHHNVFYNNHGTVTRTGYTIDRNIFAPNMVLMQSDNLYPTSVFDWTAAGYGYGAGVKPTGVKLTGVKLTGVKPTTNFSSNVTSGSAPLSVQFNDNSTNATRWNWDFGDHTTSIERNTTHTFSTAGNYTVNLTASNLNGTNSAFKNITVSPARILPVANFSANVTSGSAPLSVQFNDSSTNATGWKWDFGDGTKSTQQNPMHTYSAAGKYIINLKAINGDSTNSKLSVITVSVKPSIYGYSFSDSNGNKNMDKGEVGFSNWTVSMKGYETFNGTLISTTTKTNSTGYFAFKNIDPGVYMISQNFVVGWLPTTDAAYTLKILANSTSVRRDFGNSKFVNEKLC